MICKVMFLMSNTVKNAEPLMVSKQKGAATVESYTIKHQEDLEACMDILGGFSTRIPLYGKNTIEAKG